MANDVKLQSPEGKHPVDENLRPILVGDKLTSIETAQHGKGAKINGDLMVTGDITGNIKDMVLEDVTVDSLIIDKDHTDTTATTIKALHVDLDRTGDVSTGSDTSTGIDLDVNSTGGSGGTISATGLDIDVITDTGGDVNTARGVTIAVSGGDLNYGLTISNQDGGVDFINTSSANGLDFFMIKTIAAGATTLTTTDNSVGATAHLTLDVDGDIILDPNSGITKFYLAGDTDDLCTLTVAANGATTIATADSDGAVGHLTLDPDGDLLISGCDVKMDATQKLYLDGGGDTYITESATDTVLLKVGNQNMMTFKEDGDNGNTTLFKQSCAAFTLGTATIDDQDVISGSGHDTEIDFRFTNKISLEVTATIPNLNLIFPSGSGNFLLLLTYTGDYSITDWKVYKNDESAADGDADVLWAGGTQPDNTASGVDIFSFFYDSTFGAEKCYGVASLGFS